MHPVDEEEEDERASMLRSTQLQTESDDEDQPQAIQREEDLELQDKKASSRQISAVQDDNIDESRYSLE